MSDIIRFRSPTVTVGTHRLHRSNFPTDRPPGAVTNLIVFPLSTQEITSRHSGQRAVTDRNCVLLYNRAESYPIRFIDPEDRCDFLALPDEWALELAGEADSDALHRPGRPFDRFVAPASPSLFWRTRRLIAATRRKSRLAIEEEALSLARGAVSAASTTQPVRRRPTPASQRIVEDAKELFAADPWRDLSLSDVAAAIGASAAHLSRVFHAVTGTTLHRYRTQLAMRSSFDTLDEGDLARTAIDHGFSSHSHFTASFRDAFGRTPSQARAELVTQSSNNEPSWVAR